MTEQNGLERSSATDELRRLLDERGVEWQDFDDEPTWMGSDGEMHYARQEFTFNGLTDSVTVYHLTPEQAVEATLGLGTCSLVREYFGQSGNRYRLVCSECHHIIYDGWQEKPRYCPFCGRRVDA